MSLLGCNSDGVQCNDLCCVLFCPQMVHARLVWRDDWLRGAWRASSAGWDVRACQRSHDQVNVPIKNQVVYMCDGKQDSRSARLFTKHCDCNLVITLHLLFVHMLCGVFSMPMHCGGCDHALMSLLGCNSDGVQCNDLSCVLFCPQTVHARLVWRDDWARGAWRAPPTCARLVEMSGTPTLT